MLNVAQFPRFLSSGEFSQIFGFHVLEANNFKPCFCVSLPIVVSKYFHRKEMKSTEGEKSEESEKSCGSWKRNNCETLSLQVHLLVWWVWSKTCSVSCNSRQALGVDPAPWLSPKQEEHPKGCVGQLKAWTPQQLKIWWDGSGLRFLQGVGLCEAGRDAQSLLFWHELWSTARRSSSHCSRHRHFVF